MQLERRKFLGQSLLASLGFITIANAKSENSALMDTCIAKPSPADALDAYKILIPQIESEILNGIVDNLIKVSRNCGDILKELKTKIDLLKGEVDKSKKLKIQSIQTLINIGEKNIEFTSASINNAVNTATLIFVNEQVKETLEDILPKGENTLSSRASELVNDIAKLIAASTIVQKQIDDEQQNVNITLKTLRSYTALYINEENFNKEQCKNAKDSDKLPCESKYEENINVVIEKAIKQIDIANHSKSTVKEIAAAKKEAENHIIKAIEIIEKKLKPLAENKNKKNALAIIKTLSLAFKGIQGWIANLEEVSNFDSNLQNETSLYVQTKMVIVNNPKSELSKVIENICGRASLESEAKTITWYVCVVKGKKKYNEQRGVSYNTNDEFQDMLELLTNGIFWNFWSSVCNPSYNDGVNSGAREKLAQALLKFV